MIFFVFYTQIRVRTCWVCACLCLSRFDQLLTLSKAQTCILTVMQCRDTAYNWRSNNNSKRNKSRNNNNNNNNNRNCSKRLNVVSWWVVKKGGGIGLAKDSHGEEGERDSWLYCSACPKSNWLRFTHTHTNIQRKWEGLHMQANNFQEWWKIENQRMAKRVVPFAAAAAEAEAVLQLLLLLLLLPLVVAVACTRTRK